MEIRKVMSPFPTTIDADADLETARRAMLVGQLRHLPVVSRGRLVGVLSEHDLLRAEAAGIRRFVADAMTRPVETVAPGDDATHAAVVMAGRNIRCLVVVDGTEVVGIVTPLDLLSVVGLAQVAAGGDLGGES